MRVSSYRDHRNFRLPLRDSQSQMHEVYVAPAKAYAVVSGDLATIALNNWQGSGGNTWNLIGTIPGGRLPVAHITRIVRPQDNTYNYIEVRADGTINGRTTTTAGLYDVFTVPLLPSR